MTFQERYRYNPSTDLLGKGGFARVYKAKDILLDREVAIKIFNATEAGQYTVIEEIKKAIRLEHPNLLRYYDVAIVENTNALGEKEIIQIGVMEWANAGDLKQFARRHPNSPLLFGLLQQVLSGLEYLHQRGIIHRDLKPQNILLIEQDGNITAKISDFGISKLLDSDTNSSSKLIGTIEYMAPEQFSPGKYGINGKVGTNVDLWSFGIMVHELVTNETLFGQRSGDITAEQIMNAILSDKLPADIENLPAPYKAVVKKCLVTDAKLRIKKANELITMLSPAGEAEGNEAIAETRVLEKSMLPGHEPALETKVIPPVGSLDPEGERVTDPGPKQKPRKLKPIYFILGLPVLVLALYFIFFRSKGASPETVEPVKKELTDLEIFEQKFAEKRYDTIIAALIWRMEKAEKTTDSTVDDIYIPLYVKTRLVHIGDTAAMVPLLKKCAAQGNKECLFDLGMVYYNGAIDFKDSVVEKKDYKKAFELFSKGVAVGDARADAMLGNMYMMELGVPLDYEKANSHYMKAANGGNSTGMFGIAVSYQYGYGVKIDLEEARNWYQKIVDKNDNPEVVTAAKKQLKELK